MLVEIAMALPAEYGLQCYGHMWVFSLKSYLNDTIQYSTHIEIVMEILLVAYDIKHTDEQI